MSHHATEDLCILRSLPGLKVFSPGDKKETAAITRYLVSHHGPTYLRLDKSAAPEIAGQDEAIEPGRIRTVREGSDLTMIATGGILEEAIIAADMLKGLGVNCRILSVHTIKPLDVDTLALAASQTGGIVTIEEHTVNGGLGGCTAEALFECGVLPKFLIRIGLRDTFASVVGSQKYLRKIYSIDAASIVQQVCVKLGISNEVVTM
jgi:transketolase